MTPVMMLLRSFKTRWPRWLALWMGCSIWMASAASFHPEALVITGDPTSEEGATWTYDATDDGVRYVLEGVLFQPPSAQEASGSVSKRWPALIVHHGLDQSASDYGRTMAQEMVKWGVVVIACNYTFAASKGYTYQPDGFAVGSPGTTREAGQKWSVPTNLLRAAKTLQILQSLSFVDASRIAAHGHSRGALFNVAFVGEYGAQLKVASHTAGGVRDYNQAYAERITVPYSIHHGQDDTNVVFATDAAFAEVLQQNQVVHELQSYVYPDAPKSQAHRLSSHDPDMLRNVRAWYIQHGVLPLQP